MENKIRIKEEYMDCIEKGASLFKSKEVPTVLENMHFKVMNERNTIWEEKIKLCLRPKPRWMPLKVWKWLLRRLIYQAVEK